ncbi:glycosyltransferase family 25 protein [Aminobacter sp. MDW-2]|uniref:glycosyltransferase family 25 protein n=1 Tax=Aminobacter sp. MDW-2 TaxID=2666139 RepID=UPI0012B0A51E|nr:glycosyltransferase family 25 protein [Aminobacter sp. MDW-2]MRX33234.1 hypothetical protein [Aminobacter sp. MDW-2]QNH36853.1 glycosyltransferase family 25 protein [Aminobacter sp. MDW-2]
MRLFVINLDAATDRLQWMSDSFASLGLDFERIAAIDKNNLRDEDTSHVVGTGWTGGEVGCFLSHIEAWKIIASGTDEFGCIFEDDVHLAPDATRYLKDSNWIPQGLDLIKLETTLNPVRTGRDVVRLGSHKLVSLKSFHNGSAGYVISKKLAAKLVSSVKIDRPVDNFLFDQGSYWQISPALCIQDMFLPGSAKLLPSSLEGGRQAVAPTRQRWRPRATVEQRIRREIARFWRTTRMDRGRVIPYAVTAAGAP